GAPYSAGSSTTNFPLLYLNDGAGPTTFSTAGTEVGVNAPSGFTGNLADFHINGVSAVATLDYLGDLTLAGILTLGANGAASSPPLTMSGSPYTGGTGTTDTPLLYLNNSATAPSTWSTSGTYFGVNSSSGFGGNF